MKSSKQFVNTLEDIIIDRGAPTRLISDSASLEISTRVKDILRTMFISSWQSEPHQQHQNPAERRYQTVKNLANVILDRTSASPNTWLLCILYVCYVLNHTYCQAIDAIPLQCLTGSTPDISPLLRFHFWQPVLYKVDDSDFPSESREERGRFVGIAETVGHAMTYKILTDDTQKVIYHSNVRPVTSQDDNLRSTLLNGEESPLDPNNNPITPLLNPVIKSRHDQNSEGPSNPSDEVKQNIPVFSPNDLVGRTFLTDEQDNGERLRARIIEALEDHETDMEQNPTKMH